MARKEEARSVLRAFLSPTLQAEPGALGVEGEEKALPLSALVPSPQPRKRFENLEALAESIREKGVLQPLLVRPLGDGKYAIVAGERRYRAALMAGLSEVPVRVVDLSEKEARLLALVENLQREDLNPYEETVGVLALLSEDLGRPVEEVVGLLHRMWNEARGKVTRNVAGNPEIQRVEELFRTLGRMSWESFVRHRLPLLNLPEDLRVALEEGPSPTPPPWSSRRWGTRACGRPSWRRPGRGSPSGT